MRSVGGMATVIRTLTENRVGADRVVAHATWRPAQPATSARLSAIAAYSLVRAAGPLVAHVHLSERGSFAREGALLALARARGLTAVATIHGASFEAFAESNPRLAGTVLRRAHAIICLDSGALAICRRAAPDIPSEIIPNPVVVDDGGCSDTDELVLFAGEIGLRKGADVLVRAWQTVAERLPSARCLIVGPAGDYTPASAERLEVRGPVSPEDLRALMRRARVVVLPSRAEGMPMTLTEAMATATPFISTPVGAIPELAERGGVLVPVGDHHALADRMEALLTDRVAARELGEQGRRACTETRSITVIDARLREWYGAAVAL